jgi:hypothetical protein
VDQAVPLPPFPLPQQCSCTAYAPLCQLILFQLHICSGQQVSKVCCCVFAIMRSNNRAVSQIQNSCIDTEELIERIEKALIDEWPVTELEMQCIQCWRLRMLLKRWTASQ